MTSYNKTLAELNDDAAQTLLPAVLVVGVLMSVGVVGNSIVCFVFGCRMPSGTQNFLIVCLAVFDLLTCLLVMPTEIVDMQQPYQFQSHVACKMLRFANVFTSIGSIFTLLLIAVDRYRNVLRPFRRQMSLRTAHQGVVFIVLAAVGVSWPATLLYGVRTVDTGVPGVTGRDCTTTESAEETVFLLIYNVVQIVGFLFISTALIVVYVRILRETRRHNRYMRATSVFFAEPRSEFHARIELISDSRLDLRAFTTMDTGRDGQPLPGGRSGMDPAMECGSSSPGNSSMGVSAARAALVGKVKDLTYSPFDIHSDTSAGKHSLVARQALVLQKRFRGGRSNGKYLVTQQSYEQLKGKKGPALHKKSFSVPDFQHLIKNASNMTWACDEHALVGSRASTPGKNRRAAVTIRPSALLTAHQTQQGKDVTTTDYPSSPENASENEIPLPEPRLASVEGTDKLQYVPVSITGNITSTSSPVDEGIDLSFEPSTDEWSRSESLRLCPRCAALYSEHSGGASAHPSVPLSRGHINLAFSPSGSEAVDTACSSSAENMNTSLHSAHHRSRESVESATGKIANRDKALATDEDKLSMSSSWSRDAAKGQDEKEDPILLVVQSEQMFGTPSDPGVVRSESLTEETHNPNHQTTAQQSGFLGMLARRKDTVEDAEKGASEEDMPHLPISPHGSSATSIAVAVTSVFILSFLPHLCLMFARALNPKIAHNLEGANLALFNIFLRSYLANSALNPFVYGWLNHQFRYAYCQIVRGHCWCFRS